MPAQTALTQLGDALLRGSGDYANIQLRRRADEERRGQQLADLADARRYAGGQADKQRALQVGDLADARRYGEGQTEKTVGRQKELALWQARQLRVRELIELGLLTQADALGADAEALIDAADAAAMKMTADQRAKAKAEDADNQEAANRLGVEIDTAAKRIAKTEKDLDDLAGEMRVVPPTPAEIDTLARKLAGKVDLSKDAVALANFRAAAKKELETEAINSAFLAKGESETLNRKLDSQMRHQNNLMQRLAQTKKMPRGAPPPLAAATAALANPAPAMREAPPEVAARAAGGPPPAEGGGASPAAALAAPEGGGALGLMSGPVRAVGNRVREGAAAVGGALMFPGQEQEAEQAPAAPASQPVGDALSAFRRMASSSSPAGQTTSPVFSAPQVAANPYAHGMAVAKQRAAELRRLLQPVQPLGPLPELSPRAPQSWISAFPPGW